MHTWHRALLGALLVGAVAVAGIALNFTLLRFTQDAHDPVGKLSPRAVFRSGTTLPKDDATSTTTIPAVPPEVKDPDHDRDD